MPRSEAPYRLTVEDRANEPDLDTIESWIMDSSDTEAVDGCIVEPDGTCEHGSPSWLLVLGII